MTDEQAYALKMLVHSVPKDQLHNSEMFANKWHAFTVQRKIINTLRDANKEFEELVKKASTLHADLDAEVAVLLRELREVQKDDGEKNIKDRAAMKTKAVDEINERFEKEIAEKYGLIASSGSGVLLYKHTERKSVKTVDVPLTKEHKHLEFLRDIFDRILFARTGHDDELLALAQKLGLA